MKIIDGHTGEPHVTSVEVAAYNSGISGEGDRVLPILGRFAVTQLSNIELQIDTGIALVGGIRCGNVGNTENVALQPGTVGAWRNDLVGIQYDRDPDTLIESCVLTALQGENGSSSSAPDPEYDQGEIIEGATSRFMPLYRVTIDDSAAISQITPLFKTSNLPFSLELPGNPGDASRWIIKDFGNGYIEQTFDNGGGESVSLNSWTTPLYYANISPPSPPIQLSETLEEKLGHVSIAGSISWPGYTSGGGFRAITAAPSSSTWKTLKYTYTIAGIKA